MFLSKSLRNSSLGACRSSSPAQQCSSLVVLCKALRNAAPRDSFHFDVRDSVQATADARLQRPRHVFRRILPCWAFLVERADSAAWPHRNRGTCGFTRDPAKSLSPPHRYYFPKALKTGQQNLFSNLERRVNDTVSNWCSLEHIFYITSSTALR